MIKDFVHSLHPQLSVLEGLPLWVFVIVVGLTLFVLAGYLYKGTQVAWQLMSSIRAIRQAAQGGDTVQPDVVAKILSWKPAKHLWDEYSDTLHEMRRASNGGTAITEVRATTPAESYFTRDVLVDSRLVDDFTRHVPGVLTGLGIIGTFAGLLEGLAGFDPSTTETAVAGLTPLMDGVRHAFVASATAIGCAMVILFASRLLLAWLYRLVEKLVHAIDALYATGAGEEYLSRLVHASEKSEAHAAQLKEALVEDLSKLMTNLTERQIEAQASASQMLAEHLGQAITGSLAEPLKRMTESMESTSRGNGEAVSGMLETMLTGFMAKLEDTFGSQMRGLNDQMRESMNAMTHVQASLSELVDNIGEANRSASEEMSKRLADAMQQSADNQNLLTEQMRDFVAEFRSLVADEQEKSRKTMNDSVQEVLAKVSEAVGQLENVRRSAAEDEKARGDNLARESSALLEGLSGNVEDLLRVVTEQVSKTQENIDTLGKVTTDAISGMNKGASQMEAAAVRFRDAGAGVSDTLEKASKVTTQMDSTANVLQSASSVLKQGLDQYQDSRKTVDANIAVLASLLENAKKEAGISSQMLNDLEKIVVELRQAESQSKEYFEGVNAALEQAFTSFGNQLVTVVKSSIAETDRHSANGITQLTGVVQELDRVMKRLSKV